MAIARGEFAGARGVGGISGAGGKKVNPVYKEIDFDSPEQDLQFLKIKKHSKHQTEKQKMTLFKKKQLEY